MEVEIISRESIKPSKPTPDHCKTYKLSTLDQSVVRLYAPILLFYKIPTSKNANLLAKKLKSSLSETLTKYYPFAGKVQYNKDHCNNVPIIDCNDEGALFIEANAKNKLAEILTLPDLNLAAVDTLFPDNMQWKETPKNDAIVLAIQLTIFEDDYFSIGACFSHKIADAFTISRFITEWAEYNSCTNPLAGTNGGMTMARSTLFNGPQVFPPPESNVDLPEMMLYFLDNAVTRRFVFPATNILKLKASITTTKTTRFEAVTSLLYQAFIRATHQTYYKSLPSLSSLSYEFLQLVNMRSKMTTLIPITDSLGNFIACCQQNIPIIDGKRIEGDKRDDHNDDDANLAASIAVRIKKGLADFNVELSKNISYYDNNNDEEAKEYWITKTKEFDESFKKRKIDQVFLSSSWCRFPFYDVDFGWGKPEWVSLAGVQAINSVYMLDTKDGAGMEAWVTLDKEVMAVFQSDQQLLQFATLNPSPIVEDTCDG